MADFGQQGAEVKARIVYWGIEGSGKSANVELIHAKLRPDHRSEFRKVPTRLDPTVSYDTLPIELGQIGGVRTRILIIAVPGAAEQAPTRKQLLDEVDGIVFVVDTQRDRIDENISSLEELRGALASYGRILEEIPLVIQYNKRDKSDPYALAVSGTGVLQTLTTISKRVIRHLRERSESDGARAASAGSAAFEPAPARHEPSPPPGVSQILETVATPAGAETAQPEDGIEPSAAVDPALLYDEDHPDGAAIEATTAETEAAFEPSLQQATGELEGPTRWDLEPDAPATPEAIRIESVGQASQTGPRRVRIPMVLRDEAGRSVSVSLTVEIDAGTTESTD
jgi:signal recognition particle receptor subunit beta